MNKFCARASWAAYFLLLAGVASAEPLPAAAFASLPEMAMVCMTPDGQKVAWANDPGGKPIVIIFDLATGKDIRRMSLGDYTIRNLDWADNKTLLLTISTTRTFGESTIAERRYEYFRILAVDASGGALRSLLLGDPEKQAVTGASLVRLHTGKPETVLMSSFDFDQTAFRTEIGSRLTAGRKDQGWLRSLFEVSTRTGEGRKIETGSPYTRDWIIDAQGRPAARSEWNPDNREFTILVKGGKGWKRIYESRGTDEFRLQALAADGKAILATGARGGDREKVWSIPVDGGPITVHYEHPEFDIEHTVDDRFTGSPVGYQIGGLQRTIHWTDPKLDGLQQSISRAFPKLQTQIFDRSEDYKRVLVRAEYASNPPIYYLVDINRGTADIVGETYPMLANAELGTIDATSYKARDGVSIPVYLTLPPKREPAKLPLVVLPHGGPQARDDIGFDWLAQFFATRGYAVLQPQFRGSAGFRADLERAGAKQWGRGMQNDVTDGVRHLIDKGIADPARVCIVGGSYGGYAALAGAAFTPETYACAVSINGISDIPNFFGFLRRQYGDNSDALRSWEDTVGNPTDEDLARFSPARSVDAIRAPILLAHATNDTIVPFSQTQYFAKLLRDQGKSFKLIELAGEDHWLSTSSSRLTVLQAMEEFLAANLR
ncbi:MAG: alpha/beta fold hydrolase [Steroidobacteraceae bacterium]